MHMNDLRKKFLRKPISCNNPSLECFYLVIQVRSNDMSPIFGIPGSVLAAGNQDLF